MQDNNISSALRVALMQRGCSGPLLGLVLDEEKTTDELFYQQNLIFLVEKNLLEQCGNITVDFEKVLFGSTLTQPPPALLLSWYLEALAGERGIDACLYQCPGWSADGDNLVGELGGGDDIEHIGRAADLFFSGEAEVLQAGAAGKNDYPGFLIFLQFRQNG